MSTPTPPVKNVDGKGTRRGDDPEIYMCGPPPMIDAMIELATERHGVDEASRIFHDKFTTSADAVAAG